MVKYVVFDNELVSLEWSTVLHDMRQDGVVFGVNEGHRTLTRQRYFWDCYLSKRCNNGNLAAYPSPFAPHIRSGRIDHAIDFGNPESVMDWLRSRGLHPSRPAGSGSNWEPWHIEVDAVALRAYHRLHTRDLYDTLPRHVEFAVRRLFMHRNTAKDQARTGHGPKYHKAVKWRAFWRHRVEELYRRSQKERTRRILRKVLHDN